MCKSNRKHIKQSKSCRQSYLQRPFSFHTYSVLHKNLPKSRVLDRHGSYLIILGSRELWKSCAASCFHSSLVGRQMEGSSMCCSEEFGRSLLLMEAWLSVRWGYTPFLRAASGILTRCLKCLLRYVRMMSKNVFKYCQRANLRDLGATV
jgi:hypothetical protein